MKDKPNGDDEAPVADDAHSADAVRDDAAALQDEDAGRRHLALPKPGLPDEPSFTGEPFTAPAEAPAGEPAVEAALAWQPEVAPDLGPQSDPLVVAGDDAAPAQPIELDTATGPISDAPGGEAAPDAPEDHPFPDEPLSEPQQGPRAEHARSEHPWAEEDPAVPIVETRGKAPWPEQAPVELPAPEAPAAEEPAERPAEQPLRDRIPSVLPVELEAIKTPLEVPVFEPSPRPPEATQPTISAPTHAPDVALAAASAATAATAIPRRVDAIDAAARSRPSASDITPLLRRALRLAVLTLGALACLVLVLIVLYRWVNPPASTLMLGQRLTGTRIDQRWVPLGRISPYLQRAVITSEDGRFCRHHGVDWGELEEAIERARDGIARGGSTISMQVVKNLFLWPSKSYVRKALEFPLTFAIELAWSKPRILEIYLNIAEWGPGVFGAEAAARYHFGKSAATLTPSQAALLAVSLPNPIERRAGAPGPGTLRLANTIHARMMASPGNAGCVQTRR